MNEFTREEKLIILESLRAMLGAMVMNGLDKSNSEYFAKVASVEVKMTQETQ